MFEEVIDAFSPMLSGFCLQLCRDKHEAEDLFQETWLNVLRYGERHGLDGIENMKAWICKISVNLYLDRVKHGKIENRIEFKDNEEKEYFFRNLEDRSQMEYYAELYDAVSRLPAQLKTVVILKYFDDFSDGEIAKITGMSVNSVRTHLSKAMSMLRRYMKDE